MVVAFAVDVELVGTIKRSAVSVGRLVADGCKAAATRMQSGSSIINISSGAGTRGSPLTGPYAAAKAALNNLSETLALELAPHIRVNTVAPGPVATEAFEQGLNSKGELEAVAATIPLGRIGPPMTLPAQSSTSRLTLRRGSLASCCWSGVDERIARTPTRCARPDARTSSDHNTELIIW
jgi:NAD(P)-dependent dehydrogenase (short-subunit alcohol dehydrogenase family)